MSASHARSLPIKLALVIAAFSTHAGAAEPNDDWSSATDLGPANQVADQIDFSTPGADTTLGLFDESGALLGVDDDGSFFGNGVASAFTGFPVNADGSIRFAVSGFDDSDFDGLDDQTGLDHTESGDFQAFLTVYDSDGLVIDSDDFEGTLAPGELVTFPPVQSPAWTGGTFDLELNNFFGPPSDADFWLFSDLPPEVPFVAEVVEGEFDTLLGWYDDTGQLLDVDDDAGAAPLSRLEGVTSAAGNAYLAVTAYPDFGFTGTHSAEGSYTFRLTVVPEPSAVLLGVVGVSLASAGYRSRRAKR